MAGRRINNTIYTPEQFPYTQPQNGKLGTILFVLACPSELLNNTPVLLSDILLLYYVNVPTTV